MIRTALTTKYWCVLVLQTSVIDIRPAQVADARAYLCFLKAVAKETPYVALPAELATLTPLFTELLIASILESQQDVLLLAFDQQQIVGAIRVNSPTEQGLTHIGEVSIAVLKAKWHRGIGSDLMAHLLASIREIGNPRRLELTVQARNHRAIALYKRFGFVTEAQLAAGFYAPETGYIPVVQMCQLMNMDEEI